MDYHLAKHDGMLTVGEKPSNSEDLDVKLAVKKQRHCLEEAYAVGVKVHFLRLVLAADENHMELIGHKLEEER